MLHKTIVLLLFVILTNNVSLFGQDDPQKALEDVQAKYPIPKNAIELRLRYSFPTDDLIEKDIYLWRPTNMDRDNEGNIYITDQKWCQVFKFDKQGNFIRRIGRKGEGPGEFGNPYCLSVNDDFLVVSDNTGRKIQYFTHNGEYVKTARVLNSYLEIISDEENQIFAVPLRMRREPFLIEVLDQEGHSINSFGKVRYGEGNIHNMIQIDLTIPGEIIAVFNCFPIICKYSKNGDLISTYRIEKLFMKDRERLNMNAMKNKENVTYPVAEAIASGQNGFYILSNYPRVSIYEFDANGKLITEYYYASSYELLLTDFFVIEGENGDRTFYVLQRSPECKVNVLFNE